MSTRAEAQAPPNIAGAIYGQVLASSEVMALSFDKTLDSAEILGALATTMFVFWLAHVYARTLSERFREGRHPALRDVEEAMKREWPIVQAAGPPAAGLLLGVAGVVSTQTAVRLALLFGVVNLFLWGLAIAQRSRLGWFPTLVVGTMNAAFGLAVEGLKVVLH